MRDREDFWGAWTRPPRRRIWLLPNSAGAGEHSEEKSGFFALHAQGAFLPRGGFGWVVRREKKRAREKASIAAGNP